MSCLATSTTCSYASRIAITYLHVRRMTGKLNKYYQISVTYLRYGADEQGQGHFCQTMFLSNVPRWRHCMSVGDSFVFFCIK